MRSYPLQMTCGGDVHYSADKCLKGSVSEANCVVVWACEALEGLWGLKRYIVVPKVYPSGWWVTAASAANGFTKLNTTIFHPYLARGFGDHMLVFCLHLPCVLRVPISMQPLLKLGRQGPRGPGEHSARPFRSEREESRPHKMQ